MIVYDRLWTTMKEKGVTQYKLINYYGISPSQITRLKRNQNVNTHTINLNYSRIYRIVKNCATAFLKHEKL